MGVSARGLVLAYVVKLTGQGARASEGCSATLRDAYHRHGGCVREGSHLARPCFGLFPHARRGLACRAGPDGAHAVRASRNANAARADSGHQPENETMMDLATARAPLACAYLTAGKPSPALAMREVAP
jgi:hypothetical protein